MVVIIGGTDEFPGRNNGLSGTRGTGIIFGNPFTTGVTEGFPGADVPIPEIGGALSPGHGLLPPELDRPLLGRREPDDKTAAPRSSSPLAMRTEP